MADALLISFARWTVFLFVGGLAATVVIKLLTGSINTQRLLYGTRSDGTRYFSPGRVQLLIVTIMISFEYLLNAVNAEAGKMPTLPDEALKLLGVSNAFYLSGKAWFGLKDKILDELSNRRR